MKTREFAVYKNDDNGNGRFTWSAYSRDFNSQWEGFQGIFRVSSLTYKEGQRMAIAQAKAKIEGEPND